jgi:hypothetical protein
MDGELYAYGRNDNYGGKIYKLHDSSAEVFASFGTVPSQETFIEANDRLYIWAGNGQSLGIYEIDKDGNTRLLDGWNGITPFYTRASDGSLITAKYTTGQVLVERLYYQTVGGGGAGSVPEIIKIVGKNEKEEYEEPFEEGHRVVVIDSPTGISREYGIRDGELLDTDASDNTAIRGNVDTYAHLLALDTRDINLGIKIGDGYIVEQDETHNGDSAIYTWDGTNWNFTHLWEISMEMKYGECTVSTTPFTFAKFATNNSVEFDVLSVMFQNGIDFTVNIAATTGKQGDVRIMIFILEPNQTVTLSFGFAYKLVTGGELTLSGGMHVVTLLITPFNIVNIAPYE